MWSPPTAPHRNSGSAPVGPLAEQDPREVTPSGAPGRAWGDPAILLRCGEEVVLASTQPAVVVAMPSTPSDEAVGELLGG